MNNDNDLIYQLILVGIIVIPMIVAAFVVAPVMGVAMLLTMLLFAFKKR